MSIAKKCLAFSGLFEAELLVELMLRYWGHPLAADPEFRNELLEGAAGVLRASVGGQQVMEDIPARQMNFVAAVWYVEWNTLNSGEAQEAQEQRRAWLDKVRQSIPSCFCPPGDLP
jgi:hypothetical protein